MLAGPVGHAGVEVLEPREVPLGGPRALMVRRTLPQRARSLVGAWCFVDSYGPTPAPRARVMDTPPHPHTGLQTVSWLYQGEIEHRDSAGPPCHGRAGAGQSHDGRRRHPALGGLDRRCPHPARRAALDRPARRVARRRPVLRELRARAVRARRRDAAGVRRRAARARLDRHRVHEAASARSSTCPRVASVSIPADPSFEYGLVVDAGAPTLQGVCDPGRAPRCRAHRRRRARHRGRRRAPARAPHRRRAARTSRS